MLKISPISRFVCVACVVAISRLGSAAAQGQPEGKTSPARSARELRVSLDVQERSWIDSAAVRRAIEKELGLAAVTSGPADGGDLSVWLFQRDGVDRITVTYTVSGGRGISRTVDRPERDSDAVETVALLAGNLVRDEAGELLRSLQTSAPKKPAPSAEAKPTSKPKLAAEKPESDAPEIEALGDDEFADLRPLNLSLFHPLALDPKSHEHDYQFEIGFVYSRVRKVGAFGFTVGALIVEENARGALVSPIYGQIGGTYEGAQLSGVASVSGPFRGVQFGGIFSSSSVFEGAQGGGIVAWSSGGFVGAQWAGIFSRSVDRFEGVQFGGLVGLAGAGEGVQLAGIFSSAHFLDGVQAAGLVAHSAGPVEGVQFAGLVSHAADFDGVQLAGVVNRADRLYGLQLAPVNVAGDVDGIQIGVVNVADHVDGTALGLVSIADNGRFQPTAWMAGIDQSFLGVSSEVGPVYTMPAVSTQWGRPQQDVGFAFFLGLKHRAGPLNFAVDGSYSEERVVESAPAGTDKAVEVSRLRGLVGLEVIEETLTVFGGLALRMEEDLSFTGPESQLGLQLF